MSVALKSIPGVVAVNVSLSKGEAIATLAPGNTVRYDQLLRAIEKNGFVVKGATIVAGGTVVQGAAGFELQVDGSNERFRIEPEKQGDSAPSRFIAKPVEVTASVPEVAKGKNVDVIRFSSIVEK